MSHHDHHEKAPRTVGLAVLTVSDTRTPATDESGRLVAELAVARGHRVLHHRVVPDDADRIRDAVRELIGDASVEAVLVTGGTGISRRDVTHEAVSAMLERRLDGFGELFRMLSFEEIGPAAMLSRAVAGLVGERAVFVMPGSPAAVRLAMERLILPEIGHVVAEARRAT